MESELPSRPSGQSLDEVVAGIRGLGSIRCGEEAAKYFAFDKGYRNINHGELLNFFDLLN